MTRLPSSKIGRRDFLASAAASAVASLVRPNEGCAAPAAQNKGVMPSEKSSPWLTLPPTPALPDPVRSGLVPLNGAEIFFAQFGAGPHLLFLHGGLGSSNYWGHQIREFASRYTVTVMDTRGHGRSPVTSRDFSYALFADDATALLDFLNISSAALAGWSDGAITGLHMAMKRPERVSKLFAFGGNATPDGLKPGGARSPVFAAYAARCKSEYAKLSPHPERWHDLASGLGVMWRKEPNYADRALASISVPIAISDGEYDEIIKREHSQRMALTIPKARLLILPRVSHFAMVQDPAAFNAALMGFLAG